MEIAPATDVRFMDATTLTPIVRQALRRANFQILDWRQNQLGGGIGNPVSVGLYRFEGLGQDQDERVHWSVILKIIQSPANMGLVNMGEGEEQTHWNYWKREPLIYKSGLLETLRDGLAAPRCFGVVEQPGNMFWLWLEDISDSYMGSWPLKRYALTARHLGQLNGSYLSKRPLPSFPWMSMNRNRSWIDMIPWKTIPWEHPRVLMRYPKPEANSFRRMLTENERFLAKLDILPKTISHGDTYPTNFMSRHLNGDVEKTVALDWALMGIAPLGDDLGQFVYGAQMNLKGADPVDVDKTLFESYLDGLRDSGCDADTEQVRFGYKASAALRVGLFQLHLMNEELEQGKRGGVQPAGQPAVSNCFEVMMADDAYELLEVIH
jgi:hypothetical protein